jgi:two-component system, OmpR family, phosphate regulon response regulator OmpR
MKRLEPSHHILVVDDDRRIRELLRDYLQGNGFRVSVAAGGADARAAMEGLAFDLVILDIMMPGETGLEFADALRGSGKSVPILMLSALAEPEDRVRGLMSGSDDYLAKPFEPRELLLRIQNLLRRAGPRDERPAEARFGEFVFSLARGELRRDGEAIRLTSRERDLLRQLAQTPRAPVSRDSLAAPGTSDSARGVDVQINRLRQKIENDPANPIFLVTVRGAGYALQAD